MIKHMYAVRDRASDSFAPPFVSVARGLAIRNFTSEVNREDNNNPLYTHPEDFDLYELAQFDDNQGTFSQHVPQMIAIGKDVKVRA